MGHHFLPQHYLRAFAKDNAIWAHDLVQRRSFRTQIKSVANETSMYPEGLEVHLANAIEGPAQSAIDKLRNQAWLAASERESLARYVIAMWKRVPSARSRMAAMIPGVADKIHAEVQQALEAAAREDPNVSELAELRKSEVGALIERYKQAPPDYFWHYSVGTRATPRMIQALLDMRWVVLVSQSERFITSDNPVFFFPSEGIGSRHSELSLPLSSRLALWATHGRPPQPNFLHVRRDIVLEVNKRSASNAQRFLYTEGESTWAVRFGSKSHVLSGLW